MAILETVGAVVNIAGQVAKPAMGLYALREQRKENAKARRLNLRLWNEQKNMAKHQFKVEQAMATEEFGEKKKMNAADRYLGYIKSIDDMYSSNTKNFASLAALQNEIMRRRR